MGVLVVQGCYVCQMLPVEYAQAPFSQDEPAGYAMLSLVMHIYPGISWDILGYPWPTMLRQDCCLIPPPYPFSLEDPSDMSLENAWHARPQLFFKCLLRPSNRRPPQMPPGHVAPMTWNKAVRAVPHSYPVRCPLRSYAWTGATLSLFPSSSPVAAPQGQRVSVRNR